MNKYISIIFKIFEKIDMEGNYSELAFKGGVISIGINWDCDLDWNFMEYCLPRYNFVILDNTGWNFRHANYHEENRRTLIKAYGIKFLLNVNGTAGRFDLAKTVIILATGLGLLGLANILCDFFLLNCSHEFRKQVFDKKYETVDPEFLKRATEEGLKIHLQEANNINGLIISRMAMSSIELLPNKRNISQNGNEGRNTEVFI